MKIIQIDLLNWLKTNISKISFQEISNEIIKKNLN